ncbi:MAG: FAD-dependent 5-carboxymethylaminomethyl-2-thiouridine(34) oxidoreductase MnmC [bacterium]
MNVNTYKKSHQFIEICSRSSQHFLKLLNLLMTLPNSRHFYFTALIDTSSSSDNWKSGLEELRDKPLRQWLTTSYPTNKLGSFRLCHPTLNLTLDLHIGPCKSFIKDLSSTYDTIYLDNSHSELINYIPYLAAHNAQLIIENLQNEAKHPEIDDKLRKTNFDQNQDKPGHYVYKGHPIKQKFKHWWSTEINNNKKDVYIIGAGISGACLAYMLNKRGHQVTLIESRAKAALGGSGNYLGMVSPYFQAQVNPTSSFYISAYAFALQFYHQFKNCISSNGNIKLLDEKHLKQHKKAIQIHGFNKQQVYIDDKNMLVTYPDALNVYPIKLVRALLTDIHVVYDTHIERIRYKNNQWILESDGHTSYITSNVVLANSTNAHKLLKTPLYPVSQRHGQTSVFVKNNINSKLSSQHFGNGYYIEEKDRVLIGAARDPLLDMIENPQCTNNLHSQNKINLVGALPQFKDQLGDLIDGHAAVRAMSPDRLPLVGSINQDNQPGLYLCSGMGARGLTIAPYCAEHIANLIANQATNATETIIKAIHPQRFEQRKKAKIT